MFNKKEINQLLIIVANEMTLLKSEIENYKSIRKMDSEIKKILEEFEEKYSVYDSIFEKLAEMKINLKSNEK